MKFKTYGPKHLGLSRYIPYPLKAVRLSIDFMLFGFWPPSLHRPELTEMQKEMGSHIWRVRFARVQISYSRWV